MWPGWIRCQNQQRCDTPKTWTGGYTEAGGLRDTFDRRDDKDLAKIDTTNTPVAMNHLDMMTLAHGSGKPNDSRW